MRVLIVEDEPMISLLLEDWLNELGHEVVGPARDSRSALALIGSASPDAAIVDVSLRGETGYPSPSGWRSAKFPSFSQRDARRAACRLRSRTRPC